MGRANPAALSRRQDGWESNQFRTANADSGRNYYEDIAMLSLIEGYKTQYAAVKDEELTLLQYLAKCKSQPETYATPAERMLAAIGEPEIIDSRNDPRLSRIFGNRVI